MKPLGDRPALQTTTVGGRRLVYYDSALRAINIDPATEPANRPKTITIRQTQELLGLSARTVNRMIADGRAEQEAAA